MISRGREHMTGRPIAHYHPELNSRARVRRPSSRNYRPEGGLQRLAGGGVDETPRPHSRRARRPARRLRATETSEIDSTSLRTGALRTSLGLVASHDARRYGNPSPPRGGSGGGRRRSLLAAARGRRPIRPTQRSHLRGAGGAAGTASTLRSLPLRAPGRGPRREVRDRAGAGPRLEWHAAWRRRRRSSWRSLGKPISTLSLRDPPLAQRTHSGCGRGCGQPHAIDQR
jgi:hypothetical protein